MSDIDSLNFNSVETLPGYEARAAFTVNSSSVFKEDVDIVPTIVDDSLSYVPWGGDNQMPFDIIGLVEKDETLATCQLFNAEVCFGSGLQYNCDTAASAVRDEVEDFTLDNDLAAVTAASHPPTSQGEYPLSFTPTGAKVYPPAPTSRLSTFSTPLLLGKICKANLPKSRSAESSPSSAVFLRLTLPIIPSLIMLRFSKGNGIT